MQSNTILKRGVIAGVLGAATVAVWFFALDLAAGQPFRTPAALGYTILFGGGAAGGSHLPASAPQAVEISFRVVAAYTLFHFLAFIIAGLVFVWIAEQVERSPSFLLLAVMAVILLEAVAVVNFAGGAQWNVGGSGLWTVVVANILAVAVMSWYVWQGHPRLRQALAASQPRNVRI